MKKLLLLSFVLSASFANAQVLLEEDFNSFTLGNVSADLTAVTPGQNDYYFASSNGAAPTTTTNTALSNAQIVAGGNGSQGLQYTGPNGDKGYRYLWQDGFADAWDTRTAGNNIVELEMDINPGAGTTTSRNTYGAYIVNGDGNILAGFFVRAATRELFLVAYSTPTGSPVGNYNYSLAAAPGIQMPANVFSRIGVSYNVTTGQIRLKGPGIAAAGLTINGSAVGTTPDEIDLVSFSGTTGGTTPIVNASASTMVLDNLRVKASATDTLLGVEQVRDLASFSVFPNPSKSNVNITSSNNASINAVEMFDINGRNVKSVKVDNLSTTQLNISDLAQGVYTVKISSENGSSVKKIIKE